MTLEELLELVVPGKRDPHPCVTRCWRVGGPVKLDERGKCQECGLPTDINTSPTCELPRSLVRALVEAVQAASVLRKRLEYPEVGVGLTEKRRELLTFDSAMARLNEAMKGEA